MVQVVLVVVIEVVVEKRERETINSQKVSGWQ